MKDNTAWMLERVVGHSIVGSKLRDIEVGIAVMVLNFVRVIFFVAVSINSIEAVRRIYSTFALFMSTRSCCLCQYASSLNLFTDDALLLL